MTKPTPSGVLAYLDRELVKLGDRLKVLNKVAEEIETIQSDKLFMDNALDAIKHIDFKGDGAQLTKTEIGRLYTLHGLVEQLLKL